ncbi:hypothetical protein [Piscirickettsia salmonis]|uniref:hypothetical protein n=1 Tax=Piscirickettsia salmonis TaxID=1238 RepID=UPI0012BA76AD|nr:hypothetical protein [Piscirickettsia salmonis]
MIRRFLPKGIDFNEISDAKIAKIEHTINLRKTQFTYPRSKLRGISENYPFGS